jgi:glycolate oxidase FAD binding subunit
MATTTLMETAANVIGADAARPGTAADSVEGVVPQVVVEPSSAEAVAATLGWASSDKLSVLTRGAGTKVGWGPVPPSIDILLSMGRLDRLIAHRHGDLTATIQSGASLATVNTALSQHRQWIPLDPPTAHLATIGGLVATNDSGPRRHRYGAPRDLIIGVEFARADGRLAKGGGIVVKNVAGYDLPRLMTGSFGTLAVIVAATFKLYPLTAASKTLVVDLRSPEDLRNVAGKIVASHLTPTAVEFHTPPLRLIVRFESIEAAVEQQAARAVDLMRENGYSASVISGSEEAQFWGQHNQAVWQSRGAEGDALLKISVLPTELSAMLSVLERLAGTAGYTATGRAGLGVFLARVSGTPERQKSVIKGIRDVLPLGRGSAVVVKALPELKAQIDIWGPIGDGLSLMRTVKRQFDPAGILNPGRGPGGI